jgi:hypothetical protein
MTYVECQQSAFNVTMKVLTMMLLLAQQVRLLVLARLARSRTWQEIHSCFVVIALDLTLLVAVPSTFH